MMRSRNHILAYTITLLAVIGLIGGVAACATYADGVAQTPRERAAAMDRVYHHRHPIVGATPADTVPAAPTYNIYRSTDGVHYQGLGHTTQPACQYRDAESRLIDGKPYLYRVTAVNYVGEGRPSASVAVVPVKSRHNAAQIAAIARAFCQEIGVTVDPSARMAELPTFPRPYIGEPYWERRWAVSFGPGIVLEVSDDSGVVTSFRNSGFRDQMEDDRTPAGAPIAQSAAIQAANGIHDTIGGPQCHRIPENWRPALEADNQWNVGYERTFDNLPFVGQYVDVWLDGATGAVESYAAHFATAPPTTSARNVSQAIATATATAAIRTGGITGAQCDGAAPAVVQQNSLWSPTHTCPMDASRGRVVWLVAFRRTIGGFDAANANTEGYGVWIDAETGKVIGGISLMPR